VFDKMGWGGEEGRGGVVGQVNQIKVEKTVIIVLISVGGEGVVK
jgi:hypothetical protein